MEDGLYNVTSGEILGTEDESLGSELFAIIRASREENITEGRRRWLTIFRNWRASV